MSGLLGVVRPAAGARKIRDRGTTPDESDRFVVHCDDPDDRWSLGLSSLGIAEPSRPPSMPGDVTVLLRGDLVNESDLRAELGEPDLHRDALVARLYERDGLDALAHLDGAFALTLVDRRRHQVALATDSFGSFPLYWHADRAGLVFGSQLRRVIRTIGQRPSLSMRAVADFVTLGFVLGNKTLAADIAVLEPGTVLFYDWTTGELSRRRYFDPVTLFKGPRPDRDQYVARLTESFRTAVEHATAGPHVYGLALSGGLDSRVVLAAADGRAAEMRTYTVGVPGCADQAIAAQLSRIAGTQHEFLALDEGYVSDFAARQARMVELTDGLYVSHGLTEMLVLEYLAQTGIQVLLRGHGGELAKTSLAWPLHTDDRIYRLTDQAAFVDYMTTRANYVTPNLPLTNLFSAEPAHLGGPGMSASLRDLVEAVPLSPPELCSYLYLREHHRRFTVPSLELFRTAVEVRLPFMDRAFLQVLLSAPPEWHDDTSLHRALGRGRNPALMRVRNSNTGAAADAGRLTEMLLDKVNTILKRLNAPGYRHYHNFERWLRGQLMQTVERHLLTADARINLFVRPETLASVIERTRRGTQDFSYLLQILLIIELWLERHGVEQVQA